MAGRIRIGVSGWRYTPWRGNFYPKGLAHAALFDAFFRKLPRTTNAAAVLALGRDERLQGRESLEPAANRRIRHAVEVRHDSFVTPAFIALLRKHRIAWVVADTPRPRPLYEDVTADFVYVRLHGSTELYNSRYTGEELDRWAGCIRAWSIGAQPAGARLISPDPPPRRESRDVYCYFDNTDKLHAPDKARELMQKLGQASEPGGLAVVEPGSRGRRLRAVASGTSGSRG